MSKEMTDELHNELDIAVFEQDEMDVDKVKEILDKLDKMEGISPDGMKNTFDKEKLWDRIAEECRQ